MRSILATWRRHWPEYLMEGACLGLFMVSACLFTALLEHPASPVRQAIGDDWLRRVPMGLAMGLTAVALIHSPWGQRSGAHFNPAVTLAFFRLGKVAGPDVAGYVAAQLVGALAGVQVAAALAGPALGDPHVNYAATVPGPGGPLVAWVAEAAMTALMLGVVLRTSHDARLARLTPLLAGSLVAAYIWFEAPLSGMSLNPARTLGSAVPADALAPLWIYFTAPPAGMLLAAEIWRRRRGGAATVCAKLHHHNQQRCIFRCGYRAADHGRRTTDDGSAAADRGRWSVVGGPSIEGENSWPANATTTSSSSAPAPAAAPSPTPSRPRANASS